MAKRNKPDPLPPREVTRLRIRRTLQFSAWTLGLVVLVLAAGWLFVRGEQFLVEDPRFALAAPEPDGQDPAITITGARHAFAASILHVFREDRGQSLYRLDPEERRQALQRVEWVHDATVRRVWPNRISVHIVERVPIAFIRVPGDTPGTERPLLIDGEGELLTPRGELPSGLPLVTGIRATDHPAVRRERISHAGRLLAALGDTGENLDEIDVSRPSRLQITYRIHEREYLLILGNERFRERLDRFTQGYPEWKARLPLRAQIDLTDETRVLSEPLSAASE